jgi:DNA-directed RNA polymerase sigma subunit (sigma70/sigma32)
VEDKESGVRLLSGAREGNSTDLAKLTTLSAGLIKAAAKKYLLAANAMGINEIDILDDKELIVYRAAQSFDPSKKVKFSTYLTRAVKLHCLSRLKKESTYHGRVLPDEETLYKIPVTKDTKGTELKEYVMCLTRKLADNRVRHIIGRRYFSSAEKTPSFSELGKELGLSAQGVCNIERRFFALVREKFHSGAEIDEI